MKKKIISKRQEGKRLNEEGRLSPLAIFQFRMEHYDALARAEIALGDLGSREKTGEYLKLAQEAAAELAPFRHAKIIPVDAINEQKTANHIVRMPQKKPTTLDEWKAFYTPQINSEEDRRKANELLQRSNALALEKLNMGKPN
jgi:hypothetical protein